MNAYSLFKEPMYRRRECPSYGTNFRASES